MAIKIAESALKRRVGRVSGNTGIFVFRPKADLKQLTIDNYKENRLKLNITRYEPRQANLCLRAFRHDKF